MWMCSPPGCWLLLIMLLLLRLRLVVLPVLLRLRLRLRLMLWMLMTMWCSCHGGVITKFRIAENALLLWMSRMCMAEHRRLRSDDRAAATPPVLARPLALARARAAATRAGSPARRTLM